MKKLLLICLMTCLMILSVGCSNDDTAPIQTGDSNNKSNEIIVSEENEIGNTLGISEPIAELPILLTSSGQSADIEMLKTLLDNVEIEYVDDNSIDIDGVTGFKTLIIAVGGSSKGLGAAGIDAEDEIERTKGIVEKAKSEGMLIIGVHVGGEARRGELSDKFIDAVFPKSDYIIAVKSGNSDGMFTQYAVDNNIPIDYSENISGVAELLKNTFK